MKQMRRKLFYGKMMGILAVLLTLSMAVGVAEEEMTSGKWKFVLEGDGAAITGYVKEPRGALVVPYQLAGYPVTGIGEDAFDGCGGLTSAIIPASVTEIAGNPFRNCPMEYLDVAAGNPVFEPVDGVLFDRQQKLLVACPGAKEGTYVIPAGTLRIGAAAFFGCASLTDVTIPGSVTGIGDFAFHILNEKADPVPNDQVTLCVDKGSYGERYAQENKIPFRYGKDDTPAPVQASKVEQEDAEPAQPWKYDLEEEVATITGYTGVLRGDLMIPRELDGYPVRGIGEYAFADKYITTVTVPEGVTFIGDEAFARCYDLTGAILPSTVTSIGEWAFKECGSLVRVTMGSFVTRIGELAFFECTSLTGVTIPGSVTYIGEDAFSGCKKLMLSVGKGSYAQQYAQENKIPFKLTRDGSTGGVKALAIDNLATRSGPSTVYTGSGTYNVKGENIWIFSLAYDNNDLCWVQCEVPYKNSLRRVFTGLKRFDAASLNLNGVPEERPDGSQAKVTETSNAMYGPGVGYDTYSSLMVEKGQTVTIITIEDDYALVEWTPAKQICRAWAPLSTLDY